MGGEGDGTMVGSERCCLFEEDGWHEVEVKEEGVSSAIMAGAAVPSTSIMMSSCLTDVAEVRIGGMKVIE